MKTIELPADGHLFKRFRTEDGLIEFGLHRVMYGIRFRAGYTGNGHVPIDWCCGTSGKNILTAFTVFEYHLRNAASYRELFATLPPCSNIKPFDKDPEFMKRILTGIPKDHNYLHPEKLSKI